MYKPWVRTQVASGRLPIESVNYCSIITLEAFMYRDLYSAIMHRPSFSAERQGENEEEKGSPWSASAADPGRIKKKGVGGGPASVFISVQTRKKYQAFTLYIMRFARRVPASCPSLSIPAAGRGAAASALATSSGRRSSCGANCSSPDDRRRSPRAGFFGEGADVIDRQRDHPVAEPG